MEYVTSWERMGEERGLAKGLLQGKVAILKRMLVRRFGELPEWAESRLAAARAQELDRWSDCILDAGRLTDIFTADSEDPPTID
jgi:hypothetical protein